MKFPSGIKRFLIRICCALLTTGMVVGGGTVSGSALALADIASEAAILMDADTGQVLYAKHIDKRMYPASITKIMTGMLAMEYADLREIITVSDEAVRLMAGSSHIALQPGEQLTMNDAMYALMLPSANDAANAIAEHISGSQAAFAELMNRYAMSLGATDTHFTNAHGLPNRNHYTTAYDMALITRAAIKSENFMRYFGADRYTMPATNMNAERPFTNYQYMLVSGTGYEHRDVIGGKVGYTTQAGHTMSTVARRGGRTLICVVLNSTRHEKFVDTEKLLEYGFTEFVPYSISREAILTAKLPINDGDLTVGNVSFLSDDFEILLHRSIDPSDIYFGYDYPDAFSPNGIITSALLLNAPTGSENGLPTPLASIALPADITWFEIPTDGTPLVGTPRFDDARIWDYALIGFVATLMIGAIGIGLYLIILERRYGRRKR